MPVLGTTADFADVRRLEVGSGEFLSAGDPDEGGNEIVLGVTVASELFGSENPLGQVVRVGPWRFRVVGVLAPRGRSLSFNIDDVVFVPVRTAMRVFNRSSLFRILVDVRMRDELERDQAGRRGADARAAPRRGRHGDHPGRAALGVLLDPERADAGARRDRLGLARGRRASGS